MNAPAHNLFEVVPLSQHIGAEIRGLDMSKPLDSATVKAIYQTWLDHTVIIFRGQKLTQEDHLHATSYFGEQGHPPPAQILPARV